MHGIFSKYKYGKRMGWPMGLLNLCSFLLYRNESGGLARWLSSTGQFNVIWSWYIILPYPNKSFPSEAIFICPSQQIAKTSIGPSTSAPDQGRRSIVNGGGTQIVFLNWNFDTLLHLAARYARRSSETSIRNWMRRIHTVSSLKIFKNIDEIRAAKCAMTDSKWR